VLDDGLHQALQELAAGERVERGDRLVKEQQPGPFAQTQGEGELSALPARQLSRPAGEVETDLSDAFPGERGVPAGVEPGP
jgi:hypothetical protein